VSADVPNDFVAHGTAMVVGHPACDLIQQAEPTQ
jgi:hypothetical protein